MPRKALTDRTLKALQPAPKGKRYDVMDAVVPGFGVRVTENGTRTFMLIGRYAGAKNPTRRTLGEYGALTLHRARQKARDWIEMIQRGEDPSALQRRASEEAARARANVFEAVAEDFIAAKLPLERKGKEVARDIRRDVIPAWRGRPVSQISARDIVDVVRAKRAKAPAQARNLLGIIKRLFSWAVGELCYGLQESPAEALKPRAIIGKKIRRSRILDDDELFALWRASCRIPYPAGPIYKLLMLNAIRLNECADAARPEFNLPKALWTIPAARMKGSNDDPRPHIVPLAATSVEILAGLPRFNGGQFIFSTTNGESPFWVGSKIKKRIDRRMLRTLKALARVRGEDPSKVSLRSWKNHDIRRTVRSGLSRLRVTEEAREAVLAHARPGIKGIYDQYDYVDEKREALDLWAKQLAVICASSLRRAKEGALMPTVERCDHDAA